jgi:hypothetical protein
MILNSRPRFASYAAEELRKYPGDIDNEIIQKTLTSIAKKIIAGKELFTEESINKLNFFKILGQLRLFMNTYHEVKPKIDISKTYGNAPLVHSHFAVLRENSTFTILANGSLSGEIGIWNPSTVFPNISNDCLLYLTLMGTEKVHPFSSSTWNPSPFLHIYKMVTESSHYRHSHIDLKNASNDGNELETSLTVAVSVASHCNGICGTTVEKFIENVLYNILTFPSEKVQVDFGDFTDFIGRIGKNRRIPFLSPPDCPWPEQIHNLPGAHFGNLVRAKNSDRIDMIV